MKQLWTSSVVRSEHLASARDGTTVFLAAATGTNYDETNEEALDDKTMNVDTRSIATSELSDVPSPMHA